MDVLIRTYSTGNLVSVADCKYFLEISTNIFRSPGSVSQKFWNFSDLFRVPQFSLYLRNADTYHEPFSMRGGKATRWIGKKKATKAVIHKAQLTKQIENKVAKAVIRSR